MGVINRYSLYFNHEKIAETILFKYLVCGTLVWLSYSSPVGDDINWISIDGAGHRLDTLEYCNTNLAGVYGLAIQKRSFDFIKQTLFADLTCTKNITLVKFHFYNNGPYNQPSLEFGVGFTGTVFKDIRISNNSNLALTNANLFQNLNDALPNIIYLDGNDLEEVPSNLFNNLGNLFELNLARNKIVCIEPLTFQHLINLRKLDMSDNRLRSLNSEYMKHLSGLTHVIIDGNPDLTIEADFYFRTKLTDAGSKASAKRIAFSALPFCLCQQPFFEYDVSSTLPSYVQTGPRVSDCMSVTWNASSNLSCDYLKAMAHVQPVAQQQTTTSTTTTPPPLQALAGDVQPTPDVNATTKAPFPKEFDRGSLAAALTGAFLLTCCSCVCLNACVRKYEVRQSRRTFGAKIVKEAEGRKRVFKRNAKGEMIFLDKDNPEKLREKSKSPTKKKGKAHLSINEMSPKEGRSSPPKAKRGKGGKEAKVGKEAKEPKSSKSVSKSKSVGKKK